MANADAAYFAAVAQANADHDPKLSRTKLPSERRCGALATAEYYQAMCRRQVEEIEALWAEHADKLPHDEMVALSGPQSSGTLLRSVERSTELTSLLSGARAQPRGKGGRTAA